MIYMFNIYRERRTIKLRLPRIHKQKNRRVMQVDWRVRWDGRVLRVDNTASGETTNTSGTNDQTSAMNGQASSTILRVTWRVLG